MFSFWQQLRCVSSTKWDCVTFYGNKYSNIYRCYMKLSNLLNGFLAIGSNVNSFVPQTFSDGKKYVWSFLSNRNWSDFWVSIESNSIKLNQIEMNQFQTFFNYLSFSKDSFIFSLLNILNLNTEFVTVDKCLSVCDFDEQLISYIALGLQSFEKSNSIWPIDMLPPAPLHQRFEIHFVKWILSHNKRVLTTGNIQEFYSISSSVENYEEYKCL